MPWSSEAVATRLCWPESGIRISLLLTLGTIATLLLVGDPMEPLERAASDWLLRARAATAAHREADARIVILGIDDTDLATLGNTGDEYRAVAEIVRSAGELGVTVVALDAIY